MSSSSANHEPVEKLAEEFVARLRNGERPALAEYADKYPELADEIRELFPALVMMEQFGTVEGDKTGPFAEKSPAAAPKQLGEYRILRAVGHGGMGVVYEAVQESLGRHVALKVLPNQTLSNPQHLERFRREARAAGRLHHTNIVPVFGVGECDGVHFYAMQFIQGQGLDLVMSDMHRLRNGPKTMQASAEQSIAGSLVTGQFAVASESATSETSHSSSVTRSGFSTDSEHALHRSVARVGLQVAEALAYAHKQGVLHRDIKPSNLLLDMQGNVWITDFGLAKEASPGRESGELTTVGDIVGTIRYMAPERFDGRSLPQSDVYGLGLTLYELLTLKPAFAEPNRGRLIEKVLNEPPIAPRKLDRSIPRDLETVVLKCIAKDPKERYPSAEAVSEDLRRFLADRPILGRRSPWTERSWRWCRRNPAIAGALGLVALLLVAAAVVSSIAAVLFRQSRDDADTARANAEKATDAERWERYRANMMAVSSAMQLHNVSAAKSALDAAPAEHRNWEWHYFNHQLDTARQVVHVGDDVQAMSISPDGTLAAVQPARGPARLWNLRTRQEIGALGNQSRALRLWFSPDGKLLACMHGDRISLWDVAARRELAVLSYAGKIYYELRFSPNGTRLAGFGKDRTFTVWDSATGRELLVSGGHQGMVPGLCFSPDGRRIATAGDTDRTVHLWDVETGKEQAVLSPHDGPTSQAIFSPQGDRILTVEAYPGNALRLWDAATGKLLAAMHGHTNAAEKVAFSPDGTRIASGGLDRTVRLWDGRTGQALSSREGHRGGITSLAFSPDGKYVLTASLDQTVRLWDAATGAPLGVLHGHTGAILEASARYTSDGATIITASTADGSVRFWDARRAEWNGSLRGHESFVYGVAFHPDGERVASSAWDGTVRIWDATTGRQISPLSFPFPPATEFTVVSSVAFHPAGKLVAAFGRDGAVRFWDLATEKEAFHFQLPPDTTYSGNSRIAFTSRGRLLAVPGGSDGSVHVLDVERRAEIVVLKGHSTWVLQACFGPSDSWLATAGLDRNVRIWDARTWEQVQVLEGHTDEVQALTVSPDGKWFVSGSNDGTVRIWDTSTWKKVAERKHGTIIYSVAFTPDGTRLACACANNMIRFWDTATFQQVADLEGHGAYVHQIAFSPDGSRLVSGSGDYTVRIWDSLSAQERARRDRK